ncbi:MAG: urea ABC transporter ATP-binding subunit UrtE [Pseudomonadota bacterium]|nr:urea ABC transporter ATP-binding subunit UrtE [Pseudomonadota bacterium]
MLTVSDATLHYGAAAALRGVNMEVETGKITCLLGRNGVGKTSTIRAIVGHHNLSGGTITFDGAELGRRSSHDRARSGIALVPQGREIFPLLTVKENLQTGYACLPRSQRSIPDYVFDLFPILKTMLHRRGGDLSGGQQQQLAIGRALVMRPKMIAFDEPTEGIQPSIIKDIGRAIQFLRDEHGLTILLVEQYLDFCRELADHIYIMDRGEIVHSGAAETLDDPEVRKHLTV